MSRDYPLTESDLKRAALVAKVGYLEGRLKRVASRKSARAIKRKLSRYRTALLVNALSGDS
jgi:hypothetical protein